MSHRAEEVTPLWAAIIGWRGERLDQFDHQSRTSEVSSFIFNHSKKVTPAIFNTIEESMFRVLH